MSDTGGLDLSLGQTIVAGLTTASATVIVGLISFFGGRGSVQAQLQAQLNNSLKLHIDELKSERHTDQNRIQDLEVKVRGLQQYNESLARVLRDNNIPVPPPPKVEPVFVLDSLPSQPDPL